VEEHREDPGGGEIEDVQPSPLRLAVERHHQLHGRQIVTAREEVVKSATA